MLVKTTELKGIALAHAVAIANGWKDHPSDSIEKGSRWHTEQKTVFGSTILKSDYAPEHNCVQGDAIIERELIATVPVPNGEHSYWLAYNMEMELNEDDKIEGDTRLEAAMRCYVFSKLGESTHIPDHLLKVAA